MTGKLGKQLIEQYEKKTIKLSVQDKQMIRLYKTNQMHKYKGGALGDDEVSVCPISLLSREELVAREFKIYTYNGNQNIFYDACSLLKWININNTFPHNREHISDNELTELKKLCPSLNDTSAILKRVDNYEGSPIFERGLVTYANNNHSIELKCFGNGYIISLTAPYWANPNAINQNVFFVDQIVVKQVS